VWLLRAGNVMGSRAVLQWAIENDIERERLVYLLITLVRAVGGFRETSPNFVGVESIQGLREALATEGFNLTETGEALPVVLDTLNGRALSDTLKAYVRRARHGVLDSALGTVSDRWVTEHRAGRATN
jgi:hypothetical protein